MQLHAALVKLVLQLRHGAKLRGADGGEILGVGNQNRPGAIDIVVKLDLAFGGFGFKIGSDIA